MTKATINVSPDGIASVRSFGAEYPISGDALVLSGWKARAKLLDRATDIFMNSERLTAQAVDYFGISANGPQPEQWDLAAKIHSEYPGGLPRFVALPVDAKRRAAA